MPTYAYVCKSCHHEFDAFQGIKAKPLRACPACGQTTLKRLIGCGSGIIFKGSGFYCTDYRSDSYKSAAKTDAGGASKASGKKTDTKPAAPAAASETKSEAKAEPKEPKRKSA